MDYCQFEVWELGYYKCAHCGSIVARIDTVKLCDGNVFDIREIDEYWVDGPGTRLKNLLRGLGLPSCNYCRKTAMKMNEMGDQWCADNIEALTKEIMNNTAVLFAALKDSHDPELLQQKIVLATINKIPRRLQEIAVKTMINKVVKVSY